MQPHHVKNGNEYWNTGKMFEIKISQTTGIELEIDLWSKYTLNIDRGNKERQRRYSLEVCDTQNNIAKTLSMYIC